MAMATRAPRNFGRSSRAGTNERIASDSTTSQTILLPYQRCEGPEAR